MASTQELEVQFAQRLASNEKPVRTKALNRLRKYISVRSQRETGGFTGDELLKLWKGLFYCLWMQDKPLLQEQLSNQISTLIHSFHSISGQLLYLESFLQTFKREWTGIDRLRMDKFFQLVRFMIRQAFELLKRKDWDSSAVGRFLELLTAQLLQTGSAAPSELQFHILDLYMTELAAVGSAELTAEQNLVFIEPFCNTAATTKDRVLFGAICSSIFSTMINQAPFAIEDLIKEVKALEALDSDSDSGQASDEDAKDQVKERRRLERGSKGKQVNGCKYKDEEDDFDHLDDLDTELPDEDDGDDIGPVLQFDYASVADKLLELASQSNTPSCNRHKLYRIIKVLRDLSEGIFPQDECPEDESTDEDDEMFGNRKKMKRAVAPAEEEEGAPSAKKRKKRKTATISNDLKKDDRKEADTNDQRKRRKRRKKKKAGDEENSGKSNQGQTVTVPPESQRQPEVTKQVLATEDTSGRKDRSQAPSTKKKKRGIKNLSTAQPEVLSDTSVSKKKSRTHATEDEDPKPNTPVSFEAPQKETTASAKKKKKGLGSGKSDTNGLSSDDGVTLVQDSAQGGSTAWLDKPADTRTAAKMKPKKKRPPSDQEGKPTEVTCEPRRHATTTPLTDKAKKGVRQKEKVQDKQEKDHGSEVMTLVAVAEQSTKKKKRITQKDQAESPEGGKPPTVTRPAKKKNKAKDSGKIRDENQAQADGALPWEESRKPSRKKRKIPVTFEYEADEDRDTKPGNDVAEPSPTQSKASNDFITFQSHVAVPTPLFCKAKGSPGPPLSSRKTPKSDSKKVTFGLKSNRTAEFKKTDRSLLVSPDGSSRVPFDPKQKPKFGVLKSPSTPFRSVKTRLGSAKSSARRRPSAADFF